MKKYIIGPGENNIEITDMSDEEILQYEKDIEKSKIEIIEIQEREATRKSALAKLAALGLTEEEIASL